VCIHSDSSLPLSCEVCLSSKFSILSADICAVQREVLLWNECFIRLSGGRRMRGVEAERLWCIASRVGRLPLSARVGGAVKAHARWRGWLEDAGGENHTVRNCLDSCMMGRPMSKGNTLPLAVGRAEGPASTCQPLRGAVRLPEPQSKWGGRLAYRCCV
jgi:hypothetical protein